MSEPKLLTEAEWRKVLFRHQFDMLEPMLRERGLIAPEPVDPLLVEAREIVECAVHWSPQTDRDLQAGKNDNTPEVKIALAALRRGMELQREKLTREMAEEALSMATLDHLLSPKGIDHPDAFNMRAKRLHAALMEQMK